MPSLGSEILVHGAPDLDGLVGVEIVNGVQFTRLRQILVVEESGLFFLDPATSVRFVIVVAARVLSTRLHVPCLLPQAKFTAVEGVPPSTDSHCSSIATPSPSLLISFGLFPRRDSTYVPRISRSYRCVR